MRWAITSETRCIGQLGVTDYRISVSFSFMFFLIPTYTMFWALYIPADHADLHVYETAQIQPIPPLIAKSRPRPNFVREEESCSAMERKGIKTQIKCAWVDVPWNIFPHLTSLTKAGRPIKASSEYPEARGNSLAS